MATEKPLRNASLRKPVRPLARASQPMSLQIINPVQEAVNASFPIVGIGASAGGLEAFEAFFRASPVDSGMAFVLIPHLDPVHESMLAEILRRSTMMSVEQVTDKMVIAPNRVYVIPPNREMAIRKGVLHLLMPELSRGHRMPIDFFMMSLAEDQADKAIGIILSGTATDGTLGLRAIFGAGGVCMVQQPSSAKFDGMPQSAISAGYCTHILPVEEMPAMLVEIVSKTFYRPKVAAITSRKMQNGLNRILLHLRSGTGHDFSQYKKSTICRRIERRMAQHNIDDPEVYARYINENPAEMQKLFKELLINVTSFFRDHDAFVELKEAVLRPMLAGKPADYVFRVWIAGCATGEEAYSIAIVLAELLDENKEALKSEISIQIYATDLDDDAIDVARVGRYQHNIVRDISPERLRRFFTIEETGYKIKKGIRDMVVFAVQSVIKDPPFTRLDLLSCRNVLIYLEAEQQNRLIPNFHYALKPNGVLFLSSSEGIASHSELFSAIDRKWKFYRAIHTVASSRAHAISCLPWEGDSIRNLPSEALKKPEKINFDELTRRALLQFYAPASVVTDLRANILYVYGDTGVFLRPAPGHATLNVVEMAREGLQHELRTIYRDLAAQTDPLQEREVAMKSNGELSRIRVCIRRLPFNSKVIGNAIEVDQNLVLVSFEEMPLSDQLAPTTNAKTSKNKLATGRADALRIENLERELAYARETEQSTLEAQQAFTQELKSSNEELQSMNEELQSANEELQTSKEELQSLNEEVITVNAELNAKVEQLSDMQNDMKNLLDSINTGILFLDYQLVIRRYTPQAKKVYRIIATDVGRPLNDIKSNLDGYELLSALQTVLDTLIPLEREVRTIDGAWYLARMQPYRTLDNVIAGVVLTFTEVTEFKRASQAVQRSETQLSTAQAMAHLGSWEFDVTTGLVHWSDEMFKIFGILPVGTPLSLQDSLICVSDEYRERIKLAQQASISTVTTYDMEYRLTRKDGSVRDVRSRAIPITDAEGKVTLLTGTTLDVTESREAQRVELGAVQLARELAEGIVNTVSEPLIVLDGALKVISASCSFYTHFHVTAEDTVGRKIYDLGNGQWNIPALRQLIEDILPHNKVLDGYVVQHDFPGLGPRRMVLNARRIVTALTNTELILLAMVAIESVEKV